MKERDSGYGAKMMWLVNRLSATRSKLLGLIILAVVIMSYHMLFDTASILSYNSSFNSTNGKHHPKDIEFIRVEATTKEVLPNTGDGDLGKSSTSNVAKKTTKVTIIGDHVSQNTHVMWNDTTTTTTTSTTRKTGTELLVDTPTCRIPNFDIYDESVKQ